MSTDLLTDIKKFLDRSGMSASYFGRLAVGNSELVGRLENGGTVTLVTAERVREYIKSRAQEKAS